MSWRTAHLGLSQSPIINSLEVYKYSWVLGNHNPHKCTWIVHSCSKSHLRMEALTRIKPAGIDIVDICGDTLFSLEFMCILLNPNPKWHTHWCLTSWEGHIWPLIGSESPSIVAIVLCQVERVQWHNTWDHNFVHTCRPPDHRRSADIWDEARAGIFCRCWCSRV